MDPDEGTLPTADVSPGSSVLVAGPPMSGKQNLQLRLVAELGERRILVSTEDSAEEVRSGFEAVAGDVVDDEFGVVDCVSARSADVTDSEFVKYAPSAENLTAIGVKFTDLAETFRERGDSPVSVGFDSLSTLLMYFDVQRVYRFVRVFAGQIEDSNWTGVCTVGSTMHDEQTLHTLYDPFDAVIETRVGDDGREFRLRDRTGTGEWAAF
ncbi:RAD55 family ATPase [Halobium palmae]|uniref:RAD55 family ATPase n=1 Tax=Halobium palmae TaxID=1776492 RepID=A0ABD5S3J5_9EURY